MSDPRRAYPIQNGTANTMWCSQKVTTGLVCASSPFRCASKRGSVWGTGINEKVVWCVVKECAEKAGIVKLAPHDLRSRARLCHVAGGEIEQIHFVEPRQRPCRPQSWPGQARPPARIQGLSPWLVRSLRPRPYSTCDRFCPRRCWREG
jgi:hypothetical protein